MKKMISAFASMLVLIMASAHAQNPQLVPFNSDASSGISSVKIYTHALDFGNNGTYANPVINGVAFYSTGAPTGTSPQGYRWDNFPPQPHGGGDVQNMSTPSTEKIYALLYDMNYNRPSGVMKLKDLKPGFSYETRFYNRVWGGGGNRSQTFTFMPQGEDENAPKIEFPFNPDDTAVKDAMLIYRYRVGANGVLAIDIQAENSGSTFHCYGITNEELAKSIAITGITEPTSTGATFNAEVYPVGLPTTVKVFWGHEDGGDSEAGWTSGESRVVGVYDEDALFNVVLDTLAQDNDYHVRLMMTNDNTVVWTDSVLISTPGDLPKIFANAPSNVQGTGATVNGELTYPGRTATAGVTLCWDTTNRSAANDWAFSAPLGEKSPGVFNAQLSNLFCETAYFYCFKAESNGHAAWSSVIEFRTPGAAILGAPIAAAFADSIKFSVPLLDPGAGLQWVKCRVGESETALDTLAQTWTQNFPATLSCSVGGLNAGDVRFARFEAYCVMPDTGAAQITVWSDVVSAATGLREVIWDNASETKNTWDITSLNWHEPGAANGTTTFANGNTARFNITGNTALTLAQNIDVTDLDLTANGGAWTLDGAGKTLGLYGVLSVNTTDENNAIDTPKLSGAGSVLLANGRFRLGNSANDFEGGVTVHAGNLAATPAGGNASPLGHGSVSLGSAEPASAAATLNLAADAGATMISPALNLAGGMNAGKLLLGGNLDVTFDSLRQDDGATLQLDLSASSRLNVGGFANGLLPPWFVSTNGDYLQQTASGISTIGDYSAHPSVFTGSTLDDSTAAAAARLTTSLNLNGNTLAVGGMSFANSVTVSGGFLELLPDPNNDSYLFVPGNVSIAATLMDSGSIVRKFGAGQLTLNTPVTHDIVIQEGTLELGDSGVIANTISGSGTLQVNAGTAVTLTSADNTAGALNLPNTASLTLANHFTTLASATLANASTLTLTSGARFVNGSASFILGNGNNPGSTLAVNDGALLDLNHAALYLGNNGYAHGNQLLVNGGVITNAAAIRYGAGEHGSDNHITVSNGGTVYANGLTVGRMSYFCTATLTGSGTLWDNGAGEMIIGYSNGGPQPQGNILTVSNGALLRNVGTLSVAWRQNGTAFQNTLNVNSGARVESFGDIYVGHSYSSWNDNNDPAGNRTSDNTIHVSDSGTTWDAGGKNLIVGYAIQGLAINNHVILANGARMDNINEVRVGAFNARYTWGNTLVITNGASLSTRGNVSLAYPVNDAGRIGRDNTVLIAGGPLGNATWDMNNAALIIGNNWNQGHHYTLTNTFTVAAGGVVSNTGAIEVGRTPVTSSHGNTLRLAGGDISAASLAIQADNNLGVVIGSSGVKPVVLTGAATLAEGSRIVPSITDRSHTGIWYPIVQAAEGITHHAAIETRPDDPIVWKLRMSSDATILSICAWNPGTLLIVR